LLVVLAHSRLLWLQFYGRQTMAVLMRGLEEAFAFFGGVPAELLFDQMKAVIVEDEREIGGRLLENAEFMRFAAHWDFRIRGCRPRPCQNASSPRRLWQRVVRRVPHEAIHRR
jgi:transposase